MMSPLLTTSWRESSNASAMAEMSTSVPLPLISRSRPAPLACPPEMRRNSLALYYLTPPRPGVPERSKALYVAAPGEPDTPELQRLRKLRSQRRLEPSDLVAVDA